MIGAQIGQQIALIAGHVRQFDRIKITARTGIDHDNLLFHLKRRELRLLQKLGQACAAIEQFLRCRIKVRAEFRKRRHFAVLRKFTLHRASHFLHGFGLGRRAHTRHGQTHIHRRTDALIEKIGFKEDLAIGNRNNVRRNIGRHIVRLCFNDRQSGQRP